MRPISPAFLYVPLLLASILQARPAATGIDVNQPWRPPRYMLTYDPDLSSRAGADNLLGAYYLIAGVEDRYLPPKWSEENRFLPKLGGIGYRFAKLTFLDHMLLSQYTRLVQHEVFGHGFRAREFGYSDIEYSFGNPLQGGALTRFRYGPPGPTWDMDIAMATGGVEANALLAEKLKRDWLQSGSMEYHGALLYLSAASELAGYLSVTDEKELDGPDPNLSNDMLHYLYSVNSKAGNVQRADHKVQYQDLKKYAGAYSFDPYFWFAVWTICKTHLWSGQAQFRNPAFRIGPVRYLPGFGSMLNPWGPEFRFENLLSWDRRTVIARYRIGDDAYRRNWGLDLETSEIVSYAGATLDADLHFWRQPRVKLQRNDSEPAESRLGYGQSLLVILPPFVERVPVRLAVGGDYKTLGFLPGHMLAEGFTVRVSAAWFP